MNAGIGNVEIEESVVTAAIVASAASAETGATAESAAIAVTAGSANEVVEIENDLIEVSILRSLHKKQYFAASMTPWDSKPGVHANNRAVNPKHSPMWIRQETSSIALSRLGMAVGSLNK